MPLHNRDIADLLYRMADLLEIEDANPFRVRAYRNAARVVSTLPQSLGDMVARGEDLIQLPGVGKDLAGKLAEIIETGSCALLKELEGRTPLALGELMRLEGLGPKKVHILHQKLGIVTAQDLKKAAAAGAIRELKGFGEKTEKLILESLGRMTGQEKRFLLADVEPIALSLVACLKKVKGVKEVIVAGSYRRRRETVGDLDVLATCAPGSEVEAALVDYDEVRKVLAHGETKTSVELFSGMHVDLRVLPEESYGAALHYFTGSKPHNIAVRHLGVRRGLKINEYGVFRGEERVAGKTEAEVFAMVDLPFIEPELREDRGEIEAAQAGRLPRLITLGDIRGDLHSHTKTTDGRNTLEEMAAGAKAHGYEYLAITNHSKRLSMARGLDAANLAKEIEEIDRLNAELTGITLLKAIELDILEDGSLDLEDEILRDLDLTVCSVHYHFKLDGKRQTERIIRAMDNPYFNILAHPTGRLLNRRLPYEVDVERLIYAARERGCFMELDAQPDRLDLNDVHLKFAKDQGVKVAISSDAHSIADLNFMPYGIGQARRGWLETGDVINTRNLPDLRKLLKRK